MQTFVCRHIVWDWNGTLFDDAWLCVEIMNGLLARYGLPCLTMDVYAAIFDFPVVDYYRRLGFDFSAVPFERLSDEFIGEYYRRMRDCRLRDGARAVLEEGRRRGLTHSILSAMKQEPLRELIGHFHLSGCFTDIVGLGDHHAHGKIEIGRQWIAAREAGAVGMVFVGDTTHDYTAAQALGMPCVCIPGGHQSRERLEVLGGPVIDALPDLYRLLEPARG